MNFIELASSAIIDKLKSILDQDVAVTDLEGTVVADSEVKYFGKHLPTTVQALRQNKTIQIPKGELDGDGLAWATPLVYDNQIVGSLVLKDNGRTTEEQVSLARSLAELLIHQVMVLRMLPTSSQVLDKFFYDLFEGQPSDKQKLLEQGRFLDSHYYKVGLDTDRLVALVNFPGFWQKLLGQNLVPQETEQAKIENHKQALHKIFSAYGRSESDVLVVYFSGDNFLILISDKETAAKTYQRLYDDAANILRQIKEAAKEEGKMALPTFYPGLDGLIKSYEEAKATLSLGQKLHPDKAIYIYSDIILPRIINQIPLAEQEYFVNYYLRGLLKKPPLLKTLEAYFASDLDLKATAQKLNIHKNTLYYRLDKIEKLIGLDPRSFHNAIKIVLAILMNQINQKENQSKNPNSDQKNPGLFG